MTANVNWQQSRSVLGSSRGSVAKARGSGWVAPRDGQPSLKLGVYLQIPLEIKAADEAIGIQTAARASVAVGPHAHVHVELKRRG